MTSLDRSVRHVPPLRRVGAKQLRQRGATETTATVALVASGVIAGGLLVFFGIDFTLASANGRLTPSAAQTLNRLAFRLVLPTCAGAVAFGISVGVSVIRSELVPRWLGWANVDQLT